MNWRCDGGGVREGVILKVREGRCDIGEKRGRMK